MFLTASILPVLLAVVEATGCPDFQVELPRPSTKLMVRATDFGFAETNDGNAAAINRTLEEARRIGASRVELAPGTYRCFDAKGVKIADFSDFTFDGRGAVLVFRRPPEFRNQASSEFHPETSSIWVQGCRRTVVENLVVDWDWENDPLAGFAVARTVHLDPDDEQSSYVDFEFVDYERHPCYPKPVPVQMTTLMDPCRTRYSRQGGTMQYGLSEGHFGLRNAWQATNVLRVWPHVPMPNRPQSTHFPQMLNAAKNRWATRRYVQGELYRVQHCYYGKNCIDLVSNSDFTLRNVRIWSCFGMGLAVDGKQHHFQVEDLVIAPPTAEEFACAYPGAIFRPRPITSTADGAHVLRSQGFGRFLRYRCTLNCDDPINIHDRFTLAVRAADHVLEIVNRRGAEYARFNPGDELELRNPDFSPTGCRMRLLEIRGDRYLVDTDLPPQRGACFLVWNRTYGSDRFHFKDCVFEDTGWRDLFSCSDLTMENCTFRRTTGMALRFVVDYRADRWCEGMGTTNLVVRNCLFDDVNVCVPKLPVISTACVLPDDWRVGSIDPSFVGGRLLVEGCRFVDPEGPVLGLPLGKDVVFRNNEIVLGQRSSRNPSVAGSIQKDPSVDVTETGTRRSEGKESFVK